MTVPIVLGALVIIAFAALTIYLARID